MDPRGQHTCVNHACAMQSACGTLSQCERQALSGTALQDTRRPSPPPLTPKPGIVAAPGTPSPSSPPPDAAAATAPLTLPSPATAWAEPAVAAPALSPDPEAPPAGPDDARPSTRSRAARHTCDNKDAHSSVSAERSRPSQRRTCGAHGAAATARKLCTRINATPGPHRKSAKMYPKTSPGQPHRQQVRVVLHDDERVVAVHLAKDEQMQGSCRPREQMQGLSLRSCKKPMAARGRELRALGAAEPHSTTHRPTRASQPSHVQVFQVACRAKQLRQRRQAGVRNAQAAQAGHGGQRRRQLQAHGRTEEPQAGQPAAAARAQHAQRGGRQRHAQRQAQLQPPAAACEVHGRGC
jgi:hypothetical protein